MKEKLTINNFLSIAHLEWEPSAYNVITGEMGSGKTICLKLLYFIYEIFNKTVFDNLSENIFLKDTFYLKLKQQFIKIFEIDNSASSEITYSFEDKNVFDLSIAINNGNVSFTSAYIESRLETWNFRMSQGLKQNQFNSEEQIKSVIFKDIEADIGLSFPFGQIYFSDLRTLLAEPNMIVPTDECTREMLKYKGFLSRGIEQILKRNAIHPIDEDHRDIDTLIRKVYKILHIEDIKTINDSIYLIQQNKRKTSIDKSSSGQRELFHLLNFIILMQSSTFSYSNTAILFIEEPEAHLFPNEQKLLLELLGETFQILNEKEVKWRFFLTTHSPYLLNVFNNMLFKGSLLKEYQGNTKKIEKINAHVTFTDFNPDQVSAIFLKRQKETFSFSGYSIIEKGGNVPFLFSKEIEDITFEINDDYSKLEILKDSM